MKTTNSDSRYNCTGEKQALLNLMHYYKLGSSMQALAQAGHMNPRMWWFLLYAEIGKPTM